MNRLQTALFLIGAFSFGFAACQFVNGENFTYNLTDRERADIWISEVCLNTDIRLDECEMLVGKLGSDYGDNGDGKSNSSPTPGADLR